MKQRRLAPTPATARRPGRIVAPAELVTVTGGKGEIKANVISEPAGPDN